MAAVAAERTPKVCPCGNEFVDPTQNQARTYCLECRPLAGSAPRLSVVPVAGTPFTVPHFREWAGRKKLKDGTYFELDGYQALFLEDLFSREPDGRPTFAELWLVVPEGNGKTTFTSLLVLYVIEFTPEAWVPVAASARDQAVDLTYRIASGFVERNRLDVASGGPFRLHPGYRLMVHQESRGAAKIFASDAASGDGVDPTLALIEELHRLTKMELYETWAGKLEKSNGQLVVVSTAGAPGSQFEELRDLVRENATEQTRDGCFLRAVGPGTVLHEYALPKDADPDDLALVAQANPYRGITEETLARKRAKPSFRLSHWLRFTCNIPQGDENLWMESDAWAACALKGKSARVVAPGTKITLGFDGSYNQDSTALVGCTVEEVPHLFVLAVWERPAKARDWIVPRDAVKMAVHSAMETFDVVEMPADPPGWHAEIEEWTERYGSPPLVEYRHNQTTVMAPACSKFYAAVVNGNLTHDGSPDLARHIGNAHTKETPDGAYIRKEHRSSKRKIDLAVAAVAAFDRATECKPAAEEALISWG